MRGPSDFLRNHELRLGCWGLRVVFSRLKVAHELCSRRRDASARARGEHGYNLDRGSSCALRVGRWSGVCLPSFNTWRRGCRRREGEAARLQAHATRAQLDAQPSIDGSVPRDATVFHSYRPAPSRRCRQSAGRLYAGAGFSGGRLRRGVG